MGRHYIGDWLTCGSSEHLMATLQLGNCPQILKVSDSFLEIPHLAGLQPLLNLHSFWEGRAEKKNTCLLSLNQSCEIEMAQTSCISYIKGKPWPGTRKKRLHSKRGRCDGGSGCQFPASSSLQESFWDGAFSLPLEMGLGSESSQRVSECWGTRVPAWCYLMTTMALVVGTMRLTMVISLTLQTSWALTCFPIYSSP